MVKSVLFCFRCQMCFESSVSFEYFLCVKDLIWFLYRSLNVLELVMPMQCLVSFALLVLMVALYTISLFMHLFCNGHAWKSTQIQKKSVGQNMNIWINTPPISVLFTSLQIRMCKDVRFEMSGEVKDWVRVNAKSIDSHQGELVFHTCNFIFAHPGFA